ncbi:hypothetical protein Pmani_009203 [Petrolisthes manimaculis]|uniref:Uncharacterized protein n=1 Tax=Petrolisthes manimaculis TaxID=1843537 RepID=A0AAE1Q6W7_9EUCA|nr:hypothetical protein Pmani_009203 [Petrolisthes manimaculis]
MQGNDALLQRCPYTNALTPLIPTPSHHLYQRPHTTYTNALTPLYIHLPHLCNPSPTHHIITLRPKIPALPA